MPIQRQTRYDSLTGCATAAERKLMANVCLLPWLDFVIGRVDLGMCATVHQHKDFQQPLMLYVLSSTEGPMRSSMVVAAE